MLISLNTENLKYLKPDEVILLSLLETLDLKENSISLDTISKILDMSKIKIKNTLNKINKNDYFDDIFYIDQNDEVKVNDYEYIDSVCEIIEEKSIKEVEKEKAQEEKIKKEKEKLDSQQEDAKTIISYLNGLLNKRYNYLSHFKLIQDRLNEGYKIEDFIIVINNKYDQWINNPDMAQYIRPSTLFSEKHFENYLNQPNYGYSQKVISFMKDFFGDEYEKDTEDEEINVDELFSY